MLKHGFDQQEPLSPFKPCYLKMHSKRKDLHKSLILVAFLLNKQTSTAVKRARLIRKDTVEIRDIKGPMLLSTPKDCGWQNEKKGDKL